MRSANPAPRGMASRRCLSPKFSGNFGGDPEVQDGPIGTVAANVLSRRTGMVCDRARRSTRTCSCSTRPGTCWRRMTTARSLPTTTRSTPTPTATTRGDQLVPGRPSRRCSAPVSRGRRRHRPLNAKAPPERGSWCRRRQRVTVIVGGGGIRTRDLRVMSWFEGVAQGCFGSRPLSPRLSARPGALLHGPANMRALAGCGADLELAADGRDAVAHARKPEAT
jgi:hypothetical protein